MNSLVEKSFTSMKDAFTHPRSHVYALTVALFLTFILGLTVAYFTAGQSLESKSQNNIQAVSELNNSLGNINISTSQSERYEVSQQSNQLKEVSDQSENFNIEQATAIELMLHNGTASLVNEEADKISESIDFLRQDSNRISLEIAALDKYLQYNTAADFALLGQNETSDAERVERALIAFQELINDSSVSKDNVEIIKLSVISFNSFKLTGDIDKLSSDMNSHQLLIVKNLDAQINELKSSFNSFYNSIIYQ